MFTTDHILAALLTFLIVGLVAAVVCLVAMITEMYFPNVADRVNAIFHALMGTDAESDAEYNSYTTPPARY